MSKQQKPLDDLPAVLAEIRERGNDYEVSFDTSKPLASLVIIEVTPIKSGVTPNL